MSDLIIDKYKGCLVGLAIGDALGAPFEFWNREKINEYLSTHELSLIAFKRGEMIFPAGFYTDDSSMMLCLSSSLLENGFDLKNQFERYQKWLSHGYMTPHGDRSYGVGQQTLKALMTEFPDIEQLAGKNQKAGGNGSLMRTAPIGLHYQGNYNEIRDKSLLSSYITHDYVLAGWTCVVFNTMLSLIIEGVSKELLLNATLDIHGDDIPQELIQIMSLDYSQQEFVYPVSGYCIDTMRIALWAFLPSENYLDTVRKCLSLGNDTDTFAAIAGAMAGCYYGYKEIPTSFRDVIINHDLICELAKGHCK